MGAEVTAFPLLVIVHALAALAWQVRGITGLAVAIVVVGAGICLGGFG